MSGIGPLPEAAAQAQLPYEELNRLYGHEGPVLCVRFNTGGNYCLSGGKDRTVRLWNPFRGTHIKTYAGHGYEIRDVATTHDNSQFVSGGGDRQIFLWDVATGNIIRKFRGHDSVVNSLAYASPEDAVLVSGGYDRMVRVWDCRARNIEPLQSIQAAADSITTVIVTPRAEIFASSVDGTVHRYDVRMGSCVVDRLGEPVTHLAAAHDGESLLAMCTDGVVRLLDRATGELLVTYQGHKQTDTRLECGFSAKDDYVFAASEDGCVWYWEVVDATVVRSFQAHESVVCSVAMHPEGKCLLTCSTDGVIKCWQ